MNKDFQKHKRNDSIKWIAVFLVVILLATGVAAALTQGFKEANPYCWFGHDYDESGKCVRCGKEKPVDEETADVASAHGESMLFATTESHGINLIAEPMSTSAGVPATIAANSQTLTATVTPSDATNKVVDWSIAWKNSSSTWAKGKTISDYLTVSPTSDGALTATVTCTKAFGEQAIVTVAVRSDPNINATATVDYEQRVLGFDFSIKNNWTENNTAVPVNWSFTYSNVNPTVDFVRIKSSGDTSQGWVLGFGDKANTTTTVTAHYSDCTKSKSYSGSKLSVAPTSTYIAALKAAGFTTSATAGSYAYSVSTNGGSFPTSIADMIMDSFISDSSKGFSTFSKYTAMRSSLKSNASSVMLQIKIEIMGGNSNDIATVYNVKFSADSLSTIAEGITVGSNILF